MKQYFDAFDAGQYDGIALAAWVLLLLALWAGQRLMDRRAARELVRAQARTAFYDAQRRAQESFEQHGPRDSRTQEHIFDALVRWERWQGRQVADIVPTTPVEWEAYSLLQSARGAEEASVPM